jgi:gliding motility-associated protein GldL
MGITEITQGKKFRLFMSRLYGWGAAIVILGALFKIQHYEGAGLMLVIGLSTEAVIFFFSAFEPPHEDVDWSLVYPELAGMQDEDAADRRKKKAVKDPVAQYLDKLLNDANIGPDLIQGLGTGLKSLGESTSKMADLSNASVATNEYVKNVNDAARSAGELSQSYVRASQAADQMSNASEDIKVYKDQVSSAGKNLAALNAVYELQLQDSNQHLKQTSKFYDGINELMSNLSSTLEDTKKYKDEVAMLAKNLNQLNTVYGNMLSAMTIKH